jgi:hypothetical protein
MMQLVVIIVRIDGGEESLTTLYIFFHERSGKINMTMR